MRRALPLLLLLAACGQQATAPRPAVAPAPLPPLARIMGHPPATVVALLGSPTLDRSEGPARHLQFARLDCVLDVYFYPPRPQAAEPVARHVEARSRAGEPQDSGACIEAQLRVQPLS